jgi:Fe-S cluster assembly protein SufB
MVHVNEDVVGARSHVRCDALLLDDRSVSETKPSMEVGSRGAVIEHEATVSRVSDQQLFYLMSRGLSESQAQSMIVSGFTEPLSRELPMEYAVEFNRLIELQLEDAVG